MRTPADAVPSDTRARRTLDQYLDHCRSDGRRPSVLALASQLGLSNTTFRRHFPDLVAEVSALRSGPAPTANGTPTPTEQLLARNAKLRRANRDLAENLKFAAAHIQRLAIDNARLREALEADSNVTRIDRARGH